MTSPQTVEVTLTLDAALLDQVGAPEDLSDFVNAALRAVRDLREDPATQRPMAPATGIAPAAPDIQTQLAEAAAQRAADEAAEAAEAAKWDKYLS